MAWVNYSIWLGHSSVVQLYLWIIKKCLQYEFASFQIYFGELQENRKPENITIGLQPGIQERGKSGKFA